MPAPDHATRHPARRTAQRFTVRSFVWDLLTFDKLMTGPLVHLIYWAGLGIITLVGFTIIGGAVGLGIRDGSIAGVALGFATLIAGVLVLAALILIWRGLSEFYLAVFRIAEDLRAIRIAAEQGQGFSVKAEPVPFTAPSQAGPPLSGLEL
jgi:hypothetical protein